MHEVPLGPHVVVARLSDVAKRFGATQALAGLDLEVRAGEVLGLLGRNGSGKTTALRILCGVLVPDAGRAAVAGHDVLAEPLAARRRLAYVPEGAPLYANLSPVEHLALVGRLHGLEERTIAERTRRLLAALELADRARDPVGRFSRGMRQKAALACALISQPALLVLDEPLNGLDAPTTAVFKAVLRGWAERGGAVLYTSHLLDVAERVCDRLTVIEGGREVATGSLAELRARAGSEGTLEEVFAALTQGEDPRRRAQELLDGALSVPAE